MIYFANPSTPGVRDAMTRRADLGAITTPKQGNKIPDDVTWCADNGVFGKGFPGEDEWFAWLTALPYDGGLCAFAVAPDVVGDAAATLARSAPWLPKIRALGLPAAFVAQDGQESLPVLWDEFDVLFIGGSTDWKLSPHAQTLSAEAHRRGKRVHMGRVNSWRRLVTASLTDCDTADGTFIAFGPDVNLPKVEAWLDDINYHTLSYPPAQEEPMTELTPADRVAEFIEPEESAIRAHSARIAEKLDIRNRVAATIANPPAVSDEAVGPLEVSADGGWKVPAFGGPLGGVVDYAPEPEPQFQKVSLKLTEDDADALLASLGVGATANEAAQSGEEYTATIPGIPTAPRTYKVETISAEHGTVYDGSDEIGPRALGRAAHDAIKAAQETLAERIAGDDLVMVGDVALVVSVRLSVRCLPKAAGITVNLPPSLSSVNVS